jgi:uncharacterized protein
MEQAIKSELSRLEADHEFRILYAVESGSRAWGFASSDSDWDVRFIYIHKPDWYLSIHEKKDSIEKILPNDIDLGGWEIRKALKLFRKSNPPLLEWLSSPFKYLEFGDFSNQLRKLTREYFNPKNCLYHYFHMAEGNYREYLQKEIVRVKKYFYVLRPILACKWIEHRKTMAPMEFHIMVNQLIEKGELKSEIIHLSQRKKSGEELREEPKIDILNTFIENEISYYKNYISSIDVSITPDTTKLNDLFRKTLSSTWSLSVLFVSTILTIAKIGLVFYRSYYQFQPTPFY